MEETSVKTDTLNEYLDRLNKKLEYIKDNAYLQYLYDNKSEADTESKICVQIPDYCDSEMIPTMESCIKAAANPGRIYFAVCYQGDDMEELEKIKSYPNCVVKHIPKNEAPGLCAARYECTKLTKDVDYVFHIDSHMRFAEFWDVATIQQWKDCKDKKAILACYALNYRNDYDADLVSDSRFPEKFNGNYINAKGFDDDTVKLRFLPSYYFDEKSSKPRISPHMSGHCTFLRYEADQKVPSDPGMFFVADEISMSVRYWTHGYNIYQNGLRFIYHLYDRVNVLKAKTGVQLERFNKSDVKSYADRRESEIKRMEKLFRVRNYDDVDLKGFDLGKARSIDEYQEFAGIDFKNRIIAKWAQTGAYDEPHDKEEYVSIDYSDKSKAFNHMYGNCMMYRDETIGVMTHAYKNDDDILYFVRRFSDVAYCPSRVHFYIAYTGLKRATVKKLCSWKNKYHITIKEIEYNGTQDAMFEMGNMLGDETYVMYAKSSLTAVDNWDAYYVNMMHRFGQKAVISENIWKSDAAVKGFDENAPMNPVTGTVSVQGISALYNNHGVTVYTNKITGKEFVHGAFLSYDYKFIFASRCMIEDCPFDGKLSAYGGLLSQSARLWTHGYDVYHTDSEFLFNRSSVSEVALTDEDAHHVNDYCRSTDMRVVQLYGIADMRLNLGSFGLGHERSLQSFEAYVGMNISECKISLCSVFGWFGGNYPTLYTALFSGRIFRNQVLQSGKNMLDVMTHILKLHDSGSDVKVVQSMAKYGVDLSDALSKDSEAVKAQYLYTIDDALRAMFKGQVLRDALLTCKNILSKPLTAVGNIPDKAKGGIYFNTDGIKVDFGDNKPLLAVAPFKMDGVLTVKYPDALRAWQCLASRIFQHSKAKSVLITGSDGKTTTKCIVSEVLKLDCKDDERFACSVRNENGLIPFYTDVDVNFDDVKYYVREFGVGGASNILTEFSKYMTPDVCVLVNIGESCNFEGFRNKQEVFDTKIQCLAGLKPDGVVLINKDDEMLREYSYPCNVTTFAIDDKSADYTCKDIVEENDCFHFTAVCPDREIPGIVMHTHGLHNIYGALVAVAIADRFCVDDDKIKQGLANYRSDGIRNTVYTTYKNNTVIFDCFGCSIESDMTMLKALMSIKVPEGARHIAALGHIASTGVHAEEINRKLAKRIAEETDLDLLVCYGGKSRYFYEEYIKAGKKAVFFNDDMETACFLRDELRENDAILVKGSGSYHFGSVIKCIENNTIVEPKYTGKYADNNEFHGVSKSMLCTNITTDEVYLEKFADEKRLPYHTSMIFVLTALSEIYANRLNEQVHVDNSKNDLFRKYYVHLNIINLTQTLFLPSQNTYSVKQLLRMGLDYIALNAVYTLIELYGRDKFKAYMDEFLRRIGCNDTIVMNPQSRDISENVTTAYDVCKVLKHFVSLSSFDEIISTNVDSIADNGVGFGQRRMLFQKSRLMAYNEADEEGIYCDKVIVAKKIYDMQCASCIAIAKVNDMYLACIALDRALVYKNHAVDADVFRMVNEYVKICDNGDN